MNILLVEDDKSKLIQIKEFIENNFSNINIVSKMSYHTGLNALIENSYDLILLDMSMPMFDKTINESGGIHESFAGQMFLEEMDMQEINTKTIIVTQYESFGEGLMTLDELKSNLHDEFSDIYLGTVYYNVSETTWKKELNEMINEVFFNNYKQIEILLVDDNEDKTLKIKKAIREIDIKCNISFANDYVSTIDKLETNCFDLLILDMQLPIRKEETPMPDGGFNILEELDFNDILKMPHNIIGLTAYKELKDKFSDIYQSITYQENSNSWKTKLQKKIRHIAKAKRNVNDKIIYVVENQNSKLFELLNFKDISFVPVADSRSVFLTMRGNKDYFGIRDRDLLTDNEVKKLTTKFPKYVILEYYCFENYLYHPDNLEELNIEGFNKDEYKSEIIKQKNQQYDKIILPNLKLSRNNYEEFKVTSEKIKDKNVDSLIDNLKSEEFETFYKSFDMKKTFNRTVFEKFIPSQEKLAKTEWFKSRMKTLLITHSNN